jgi:hypothetical protein
MSFELLFDDIVRERGLSSAPDLAIARAAARLLAADDGSPVEAAAAVAKLLAMLPPKTASPVMNLSSLTDEEVSLFERLIKKIHGQPVEPIPTIQVEFVNPAPADDSAEEARRLRDDLQVARGRIEALEQMLGSGPQKPKC